MAKKRASRTTKPRAYSMPELSELYPRPPFHYREISQLIVEFETDAKTMRRLVPAPVTPNKENQITVSIANFLCSGFGRYLEAHVFATGTFKRRPVNFSIYLILDNDVAIGAGREIWGFPKKFGRLTLDIKDDVVSSQVERGGRTIIDAAMHLQRLSSAEELGGTPEWIARRYIPNVSNEAPPDIDQLTSTTLTDIEIFDVYAGRGTINFGDSPADRLCEIPVKSVSRGFYVESQFTLGDGEVVHDYLK
ncbi:MAG: acetoacetate decarboxylase family protein [Pseudomonadota bacterium]